MKALCQKLQTEQDQEKFSELVLELYLLLGGEAQQLKCDGGSSGISSSAN
jgi:hypothetical protein